MTWLRIEGRMPHHRKVAPLSDAAFRLHVTAQAWCVEEGSDGKISKKIPQTLQSAPRGKNLERALAELTESGLWDVTEDGYSIHDFLEYNPSAAENKARRESKISAGAAGGRAKASKPLAPARFLPEQTPSKNEAEGWQEAKQNCSPIPIPIPEREDPPTPKPEDSPGARSETRIRTGDRFADSFAGFQLRPEVMELHEAFRQAFLPEHKFMLGSDEPAILAEAIRLHTLENCLLVVKHAHFDGMVNGTRDDKGNKHESIGYIFGNATTFARILKDAKKKAAENSESVGEMIARRKAVQAGTP